MIAASKFDILSYGDFKEFSNKMKILVGVYLIDMA